MTGQQASSGQQKKREKKEKYSLRLDKYRRRVRLTYTVGAGLGTLAALLVGVLGGSLLDADPVWLKPLFLTFFIITGACLAMTYIQFEWAVTSAERELDATADEKAKVELLNSPVPAFPGKAKRAESWWKATQIMLGLTVVAFLAALWWTVVGNSTPTPTPTLTPTRTPTSAITTPATRPPTTLVTVPDGRA